jgi:hypothetical protein
VSGRDLELYFRQHPHERPELMQAPGQLLLKASRPFDGVDRVYQVGLLPIYGLGGTACYSGWVPGTPAVKRGGKMDQLPQESVQSSNSFTEVKTISKGSQNAEITGS